MSEGTSNFEAARLTVRLSAIAANHRTYRRMAGPTAVAAVVKADAYGLGAARVAPALAQAGCDSFFVAGLRRGKGRASEHQYGRFRQQIPTCLLLFYKPKVIITSPTGIEMYCLPLTK